MNQTLQRILPQVQKPARYTGGEYNEIQKNPADVRVNVAFCFPDTYEIGMSNVGMRILYGVMNEMEGVYLRPGQIWKKPWLQTNCCCGPLRVKSPLRILI